MFKIFKLFVLEQRLRFHSGKYEAYLNRVREKGVERDYPARFRIAADLLREPALKLTMPRLKFWLSSGWNTTCRLT